MIRRSFIVCLFSVISLITVVSTSCSKGTTVKAATKLLSTTLTGGRNLRSERTLVTDTATCGTGFSACITPDGVVGKAYYAGMIVGKDHGLSLGPLIGTVTDASKATDFSESELLEFDFSQQLVLTGAPVIGGPIEYPADDQAYVQNFHVYLGWIDTTFTLAIGEGIIGTHVIRQVMADIAGTDMKKGDKMYRLSTDTDFKYCVTGSGCTGTTRPASPVQDSAIASFTNTSEGNKTIPSFFVDLAAGTEVQIKKSDLTSAASTNTFTVDFAMTNGVKFTTAASEWATTDKLVSAFSLSAKPGDDDSAFTATITYTP